MCGRWGGGGEREITRERGESEGESEKRGRE
jgi:hypothetical protein